MFVIKCYVLRAHGVIKSGLQTLISVCAHLLRLLICSFEQQISYGHSVLSSLNIPNRRAIIFVL